MVSTSKRMRFITFKQSTRQLRPWERGMDGLYLAQSSTWHEPTRRTVLQPARANIHSTSTPAIVPPDARISRAGPAEIPSRRPLCRSSHSSLRVGEDRLVSGRATEVPFSAWPCRVPVKGSIGLLPAADPGLGTGRRFRLRDGGGCESGTGICCEKGLVFATNAVMGLSLHICGVEAGGARSRLCRRRGTAQISPCTALLVYADSEDDEASEGRAVGRAERS
jgi:hypothetical protein